MTPAEWAVLFARGRGRDFKATQPRTLARAVEDVILRVSALWVLTEDDGYAAAALGLAAVRRDLRTLARKGAPPA